MKITDFYDMKKCPVTSVNKKTGDVYLNASDINAISYDQIGVLVPSMKDGVILEKFLPIYSKKVVTFSKDNIYSEYQVLFQGVLVIFCVVSNTGRYYILNNEQLRFDFENGKTYFNIRRFLIEQSIGQLEGTWRAYYVCDYK